MMKDCLKSLQLLTVVCSLVGSQGALAGRYECLRYYSSIEYQVDVIEDGPDDRSGAVRSIKEALRRLNRMDLENQIPESWNDRGRKTGDDLRYEFPSPGKTYDFRYFYPNRDSLDYFKIKDNKGPGKKILPGNDLIFADGRITKIFKEGMFTKIDQVKSDSPHLSYLGLSEADLSLTYSDRVLVLGDGFKGTVASEVLASGRIQGGQIKSLDLIFDAETARAHDHILKDYEEKGDARKLESIKSNSQKLVLAKDLLDDVPAGDLSNVVNAVSRVLQIGGEARLSFSKESSGSHVELLKMMASQVNYSGPVSLEIVYTSNSKKIGYLVLKKKKLSSNDSKGSGLLPSMNAYTRDFLDFWRIVDPYFRSEGKLTEEKYSSILFDRFKTQFVSSISETAASKKIISDFLRLYFVVRIYEPLSKGDLAKAVQALMRLDTSDLMKAILIDPASNKTFLIAQSSSGGSPFNRLGKRLEMLTLEETYFCQSKLCGDAGNRLFKGTSGNSPNFYEIFINFKGLQKIDPSDLELVRNELKKKLRDN